MLHIYIYIYIYISPTGRNYAVSYWRKIFHVRPLVSVYRSKLSKSVTSLRRSRRVLRGVVSFQLRRQTNGAKQEANFLSLNEQGQKATENIIFISSNWKIKETSENKTLIFLFEISPGLVLLRC